MKVRIEVELPTDFYVGTASDCEVAKAVMRRMQDAFDWEWCSAKSSTVKITSLTITDREAE